MRRDDDGVAHLLIEAEEEEARAGDLADRAAALISQRAALVGEAENHSAIAANLTSRAAAMQGEIDGLVIAAMGASIASAGKFRDCVEAAQAQQPDEGLLSRGAAAKHFGADPKTVDRYAKELGAWRKQGGRVKIDVRNIDLISRFEGNR